MKKTLLSLMILALLTLVACKDKAAYDEKSADNNQSEAPNYALFNKNVDVMNAFIAAHSKEDLAALTAMISDTLKWSPPHYNGNTWLGKTEYLAALKGYHDNFDNISYTGGIPLPNRMGAPVYSGAVYPETEASSALGALRQYGTWSAKHTASGKMVGVKWYSVGSVNADGKIAMLTDYFDVHGLAAQIEAD